MSELLHALFNSALLALLFTVSDEIEYFIVRFGMRAFLVAAFFAFMKEYL